MAATQVTIHGAIEYPAYSQRGLLKAALPLFVEAHNFSSVAIVSDSNVAPLYGESLCERLSGANSYLLTVPAGERYKNLDTVRSLYNGLLERQADREVLIIALGGGVVGDMAGFVAASYMRGVALVQAPTTLLAMVDASIGGKVGVDLPQGKNLVGAFKDPLAVFADVETLSTLAAAERRAGMAEVVKAALIGDPPLLPLTVPDDPQQVAYESPQRLPELIQRAIAVKARIVAQDRLEKGVRASLNLGHTFAHAFELLAEYKVRHGDAVALGLIAAARLSHRLSLCTMSLVDQVEGVVRTFYPEGGPLGGVLPGSLEEIWQAMQHDKKWRSGRSRFVLLEDAGRPRVVEDVPRSDVFAVLESLGSQV